MDSGINLNYPSVPMGTNKTGPNLRSIQLDVREKVSRGELVLAEGIIKSYGYSLELVKHVHAMMRCTQSYGLFAVISPRYGLEMPAGVIGNDPYVCPQYNDAFMLSLTSLYASMYNWCLIESSLKRLYKEGIFSSSGINIPGAAVLLTMRDIYISNRNPEIEQRLLEYVESKEFNDTWLKLSNYISTDKVSEAMVLGLKTHLSDESDKIIARL